jgi:dihydroorotate dehydrogenase (fumarate)
MDLSTNYLGFNLPHPLIPGACPLANDLDMVRRLEDAGAPMITLTSLFEEELRRESLATSRAMDHVKGQFSEALSYLPEPDEFTIGPEEYLDQLRRTKAAVGVPVAASLNGSSRGGWLEFARLIEDAGADALELNLYRVSGDAERSAGEIEDESVAIVKEVCDVVSMPVAVKLSPFYTSLPHLGRRLSLAGADAMVIFNRFYQPDIDVETLDLVPTLQLSTSEELQLRLRWLAILSGRVNLDLAVTGGVHTALDAIKAVMCGADACQMVSSLLLHGPHHLAAVREAMAQWLEGHEYHSLNQAHRSMNLQHTANPDALMRANYLHVLRSWEGLPTDMDVESI